jgi:hypothetical protein
MTQSRLLGSDNQNSRDSNSVQQLDATPALDDERGSMYDMFSMPLVFAWGVDGETYDGHQIAEMFDYGVPTVEQLTDMLRVDGTASQLESALTLPIRRLRWSIAPVSDNTRQDVMDTVTSQLTMPKSDGGLQTPFDTVLSQITSSFIYRRSYHEKVWQAQGSQVALKKIAWRPADSCVMLRDALNGDLAGFKQRVPLNTDNPNIEPDGYVTIPVQYAVTCVHNGHRDPVFGVSDFDVVYQCYQTKQKLMFLWATYLEVMGLPRTVVAGDTADNAKKAAKVLAALRSNGVAGIPASWMQDIKFLPVGSGAGTQYQDAINYMDQQMADSILAGFVRLSGHATSGQGSGSYALSKDQSGLFLQLMQAYATEIETQVTDQVITDIVRYNYGSGVEVPKLTFGQVNEDDIQLQVQLFQAMAVAPNLNPAIPSEFLTELLSQIAAGLGLDVQEMKAAVDAQAKVNEQQAQTQQQIQMAQIAALAQQGAARVQSGLQKAATPSAGVSAQTNPGGGVRNVPATSSGANGSPATGNA